MKIINREKLALTEITDIQNVLDILNNSIYTGTSIIETSEYFIKDAVEHVSFIINVRKHHGKKIMYIWFDGSNQDKDFDFNFNLSIIKKIQDNDQYKLHKGFSLSADIVFEKILHYITDIEVDKVVICGHSFGAAVATLISFKLHEIIPDKLSLIGLATPRVGDRAFKKVFSDTNIDAKFFINHDDLIRLSPTYLLGLRHIKKHIRIILTNGLLTSRFISIKDHLQCSYAFSISYYLSHEYHDRVKEIEQIR